MTIAHRDLAAAYRWAREHARPGSRPRLCADLADAAFDGMQAKATELQMQLAGDDRAENLTHAAFKLACESNGLDWRGLVA